MDDLMLDEIIKKKVNFLTERYFQVSTGGNNRQWAKRYTCMLNQWRLMENSSAFSSDFKEGYKMCLSNFHNIYGSGLNN